MKKLLGISLALIMLVGSTPFGFSEPLKNQLDQGNVNIQCDNPNHVLVERPNDKLACVTEKTALKTGWQQISFIDKTSVDEIATEQVESVSLNGGVTTPLTLDDSEIIILSTPKFSASKYCTEWPKTSIALPSVVQVGVPFDVTYNWSYVVKNNQGEILNMLFEEEDNDCNSNALIITKPYFVDIKDENFTIIDEKTDWTYIPPKIYQTGTLDVFGFDNTELHSETISVVIQKPTHGNSYGYFEFGASNQFTSANITFDGDFATIRDSNDVILSSSSYGSLISNIPDDEKVFNATTTQINRDIQANDPQYQELVKNYTPTLPDIGEIVDFLQEYHPDKDLNDELIAIGYSQEEINTYLGLNTQFFSPVLNWILPQALAVPSPSIYITGQVTYTKENTVVAVPLTGVQVCFWDLDVNGLATNEVKNGANQACGYTSSTGSYGIGAEYDDPDNDGTTIDLVVSVRAKGLEFQIVHSGSVGGQIVDNIPNSYSDINNARTNIPISPSVYNHGIANVPSNSVLTEALHLRDDLIVAEDWIDTNLGYDVPPLEVFWQDNRCGTYYDTVNTKMWIGGNDRICPTNDFVDIVYHEYGHHLMVSVYNDHGSALPDVTAVCANHNPLTNTNNECAWVEGFASFVPTMINNNSTNTEFVFNGASPTDVITNYEDGYVYAFLTIPQTNFPSGANNEGRVTAALWDMIDGTGEQDNVNTERVDDLNGLMTAMWFTFDDNLNGETVIADNILDYRDDWNDNGFTSLDPVYYLNTLDTFVPSTSEPPYDIFYSNLNTEDIYRTDTAVSTLSQFIAKGTDGLYNAGAIAIGGGTNNDEYLFILENRGNDIYRYDANTGDAYGEGGSTTDAKINLRTSSDHADIEMRSDGQLFLSTGNSAAIKFYNTNGNVLYPSFTHFDFTGSTTNVGGMAFDSNDALYIVDITNGAILKHDGTDFNTFVANGVGGLSNPFDIAIGYNDALYVSSTTQDKIYRFDNTGTPSGGTGSSTDATYTTSNLDEPSHIVISPGLSTLYIANFNDDTILSINTLAAGAPVVNEFVTDNGNTDEPFGIAVGPIVIPDTAPLIRSISAKHLSENTVTEIIVKAYDSQDDTIALSLSSNNSTFTSIHDYGNGTAKITMSPLTGDAGFYTVIVKALANGLDDYEDFDITVNAVIDNIPPNLTVPSDRVIETRTELTILNSTQIGIAVATDNIDPSPVITNNATNIITNGFPLGDTVILWNATDISGNSATDIQTITLSAILSKNITSATGSGSITVLTDKGILSNATSIDESTLPTIGKPSVSFPHGLVSLNVTGLTNGDTVVVSITFPTNIPTDSQYWKIINNIWTNATSILGSNDGDDTITLTLTDGGAYDADGQADGTITDPGGIALADSSTVPDAPTLLTATAINGTRIDLSWNAPENNGGKNVTSYFIERNLNNTAFANLANTTSIKYTDLELSENITAKYRVSAINEVGVSLPSNEAQAITSPPKPIFQFTGTVRDLNANHPNMSMGCTGNSTNSGTKGLCGAIFSGIVGDIGSPLGDDGTPIFANTTRIRADQTLTNPEDFYSWYHTVQGISMEQSITLNLTQSVVDPKIYTFDSGYGFFPIDNQLFAEHRNGHNYYFTIHLQSTFAFDAPTPEYEQSFTFSGDDDVWVFVDKKLILDVGGVHSKQTQTFTASQLMAAPFNLVPDTIYNFDFFFAERQCCGSNFRIDTSINFDPSFTIGTNGTAPPQNGDFIQQVIDIGEFRNEARSSNSIVIYNTTSTITVENNVMKIEFPANLLIEKDMRNDDGNSTNNDLIEITESSRVPDSNVVSGTIQSLIEIGDPLHRIDFNKAVKVTLFGQFGNSAFYIDSDNVTHLIEKCESLADSDAATTYLDNNGLGECYQDANPDLVIWTMHFTGFGSSLVSLTSDKGCYDCTPPTFGMVQKTLVINNGFTYNGNSVDVTDYHTLFPLITVNTDEINTITVKVLDDLGVGNIRLVQFGLGMPKAGSSFYESQSLVEVWLEQTKIADVEKIDENNLVDIISSNSKIINCETKKCLEITLEYQYRDQPKYNVIGINAMDNYNNSVTNYLNDGVTVEGDSLNIPLEKYTSVSHAGIFYPQKTGSVLLTLIDYKSDHWQDEYGYLWSNDEYGRSFIVDSVPMPIKESDPFSSWSGYNDRDNSEFAEYKLEQIEKANQAYYDLWGATYSSPATLPTPQQESSEYFRGDNYNRYNSEFAEYKLQQIEKAKLVYSNYAD